MWNCLTYLCIRVVSDLQRTTLDSGLLVAWGCQLQLLVAMILWQGLISKCWEMTASAACTCVERLRFWKSKMAAEDRDAWRQMMQSLMTMMMMSSESWHFHLMMCCCSVHVQLDVGLSHRQLATASYCMLHGFGSFVLAESWKVTCLLCGGLQ